MHIKFALLPLSLVLAPSVKRTITPKPGLWEASAQLTGRGKVFGGEVPPTVAHEKQCITTEAWIRMLDKMTVPPGCTLLKGKARKVNYRELNYACPEIKGRAVADILSTEAVRMEFTQRIEANGEVDITTDLIHYRFLSDSCDAALPVNQ